jgi:sigma-B regulation protein RsbU (phosphoserine phosphatase)
VKRIGTRGIAFRFGAAILTSVAAIFLVVFGVTSLMTRAAMVEAITRDAGHFTEATVLRMESILTGVEKVPAALAQYVEQAGGTEPARFTAFVHSLMELNPEIFGLRIAFEPYEIGDDQYFAPYFFRRNGRVQFTYLGDDLYRYFQRDWYKIPLEQMRPGWSEPYLDEGGSDAWITTYSLPMYRYRGGKREPVGVVGADVRLEKLQRIVSELRIAETGYGMLITRDGTVLTHPDSQLPLRHTIFTLAELFENPELGEVGQAMLRGESGFLPMKKNRLIPRDIWVSYAPLPASGWSLALVFPRDELMAGLYRLRNRYLAMGGAGMLFLLLVIAAISGTVTRPLRRLAAQVEVLGERNLETRIPPARTADEVGQLTEAFRRMRNSIRAYVAELAETSAAKERIESELRIAHDIQMGFLPGTFSAPAGEERIAGAAVVEPAREVGGDFYDFFFPSADRFCVFIGDVSGKGVPAALLMARAMTLLRTRAQGSEPPEGILARVNEDLLEGNEDCMFATVFLALVDLETGETTYASGGHNPPILRPAGEAAGYLEGPGGPALGLVPGGQFTAHRRRLSPGDALILYTDGITESRNPAGEMFGEERLLAAAGRNGTGLPEGPRIKLDRLRGAVREYADGILPEDDLTLLVLQYRSRPEESAGDSDSTAENRNNETPDSMEKDPS